jgi:hypothetical protein
VVNFVSQTSSGSGGSAAPGWYTDPHDPRQLRWWSGDGWTEHVSPQSQPVAQAVAAPVQAQPVAAQPVQQVQPEQPQPVQVQPVQPQAAQPQAPAQPVFAQPQPAVGQEALPSRRALRDPATDTTEAAAAAQAAFAQQQVQQQDRPLTFLEKQGYPATPGGTAGPSAPSAPAAPTQPNAWDQPVQAVQPQEAAQAFPVQAQQAPQQVAPVQQQPVAPQPTAQQPVVQSTADPAALPANAWDQPVQLVEPAQPVQPAQANAWNQPVQGAAPAAQGWGQPVADPAAPGPTPAEQLLAQSDAAQQNLAATQNYAQPTAAQPAWGLQPTGHQPGAAIGAAPAAGDGIDSLFGGPPAAAAVVEQGYVQQDAAPAASAWGLSPSGRPGEEATRPRGSESRGRQTRAESSTTVWSWLIAASPIIAALAIGYVLKAVGSSFGWQLEAALAAPYLLVILFAIADRSTLIRLGIDDAATWIFAVLTAPIYLLMRASVTRRETGTGNGPLIGWFVALIIAAIGFVGFGLLTHAPLYPGLPS